MCLNSPSHGLALKKRVCESFRKAAAKLLILFGICKYFGGNYQK